MEILLVTAIVAALLAVVAVAVRRLANRAGELQLWQALSRRGLEPEDAAPHDRSLAIAVRRCALCPSVEECEHWLAGERHDPSAFCPNTMFMENLQREKRRTKKAA